MTLLGPYPGRHGVRKVYFDRKVLNKMHENLPDNPSQDTQALARSIASVKPVQSLGRSELRVLGVLIEKAKTTPEQYPLSLNAVVTGCNQKSNRDPVMNLDEEQVNQALIRLRECGAAAEVFGNGRLARYRHLAYEWLGVEKEELAILAELFLRGGQSEGCLFVANDHGDDRRASMWNVPALGLETAADLLGCFSQLNLEFRTIADQIQGANGRTTGRRHGSG